MPSDVKKICKGANVDTNGFAIKGLRAKDSKDKVKAWAVFNLAKEVYDEKTE